MKKQLNVRLVAIVLGTFAALGVGTHFLHAYQVQRNANSLLDLATAAEKRGQVDDAARYLSSYVGLRPGDTAALARLGELLADERIANTGNAKHRALQILNKVLYRDPERNDIRRSAVKLAIDLGRFTDAREDLQNHLLKAYPNDGELKVMLARCLERTAEYQAAREWYERAIQDSPKSIDAYLRLAALLRQRDPAALYGDTKHDRAALQRQADKIIEEMVAANPQSYRAYLSRANYRRAFHLRGNDAAVRAAIAEDIATAQKLAGDEVDVILAAGELARDQKQFDEGRKILRRGCDIHPNDWRLYKALARLEVADGHRPAAIDCLNTALQRLPKQPDLLWDLAECQIDDGRKADAAVTIARLAELGIPAPFLDCLTARIEMADSRWEEAARRLETAFFGLNDLTLQRADALAAPLATQAGLMLGTCYEKLGDAERALRAYSRVNARDAASVAALMGMGRNSFALWRLQEAMDQYRQALRLPDAPVGALVEIARITLLRTLERPPNEQNWPDVESLLAQARKPFESQSLPIPMELIVLEAEAKAAQKQFDAAREILLQRFGDAASRPVLAWTSLSGIDLAQGRTDAALALLAEAEKHTGDSVDLRVARARTLATSKTPEARAAIAALAEKSDAFPVDDQARLLRGLAVSLVQAGDVPASVKMWERVAALRPGDVVCRTTLFDLAAETGDADGMIRWARELEAIEKDDGVMWRYARVRTLIDQARRGDKSGLPEARKQLAAIAAQRPDWSRVAICEALIDDLSGQTERAVEQYLRAIKLGATDAFLTVRAAELLYFLGRYAEANALFSKVSEGSLPPAVQQVAADSALQARDSARALNLAQLAASAESKDFRRQMWLGWMYWRAGEFEKAKAAFVRSRELAADNPDTWVALVLFLANNNQMDAARAEVDAAEKKLQGPTATLALANCNAMIGRVDRANTLFREALAAKPDDPVVLRSAAEFCVRTGRLPEAQVHLRKLLAVSRASSPETFAMARRMLAYLLSTEGDPENAREALALFGPEGDSVGLSASDALQDRRTRAQLLALRNTRDSHREAVQILEDLLTKNQGTADDCFLAAQLHESLGDWAKSRRRLQQLINQFPDSNAGQWAAAARSFLRHKELGEAAAALGKLKEQQPDAALTREIQARLLHAEGRKSDAVALVKEMAQAPDADLAALGFLLSEFDDQAGAEALLRRFVAQSKQPDSVLILVRYLISQKRLTEALDLCDRAWGTASDLAVADACLLALGQMDPDAPVFQRVESQMQAALAKNPGRVELQVALATVRSLQGRYDDAITQYRRVLEKHPRNAAALNNLAWLLAMERTKAQEALALADLAVEVSGQNPGMIDTRAVAALAYGTPDAVARAIRDLETLAAQVPSATVYFHLAQAYHQAQRRRDAALAWQRANALGLTVNDLHPLERPTYDQLRKDLSDANPSG